MKKLYLLLIMCLPLCVNAQSRWVVLSEGGNYLFETRDSLTMIDSLKAREVDNYILVPDSPRYLKTWGHSRYNVLSNPVKGHDYRSLKGVPDSMLYDRLIRSMRVSDTVYFRSPRTDSLPDGNWYEYIMDDRQNIVILIQKQIRENKITGDYIISSEGSIGHDTYKNGFPIGRHTNFHSGRLGYECLYKDSLWFKVYAKLYDTTGNLFYFYDMNAGFYYQYFPDGKTIEKKCPLNMFGELEGVMEVYNLKSELIDKIIYKNGEEQPR